MAQGQGVREVRVVKSDSASKRQAAPSYKIRANASLASRGCALPRSGCVKISDIKSVKSIKALTSSQALDKNSAFVVRAGERTLILRSESFKDADRWVRSIQMQVDLR